MGWGDEVLATGQAKVLQESNPARPKVLVHDKHGHVRSHEAWLLNPRFVKPGERCTNFVQLAARPGDRPYIAGKSERKWIWKTFNATPGEFYFTPHERDYALAQVMTFKQQRLVVIEPNIKYKASPNKRWLVSYWLHLIDLLRRNGLHPVQLGPPGTAMLPGTALISTPTYRHAAAILAHIRSAVVVEGGLHHAAAAVGTRAVVIYGGFISPQQTGYAMHRNLFTGGEPCGMRVPCEHCAKAMAKITPEQVFEELTMLLAAREVA